jgi:hypothetical protein
VPTVSKLIATSRSLRVRLRKYASSPTARMMAPGLCEQAHLVDELLEQFEDLEDRVALLEIACGTYLVGERVAVPDAAGA